MHYLHNALHLVNYIIIQKERTALERTWYYVSGGLSETPSIRRDIIPHEMPGYWWRNARHQAWRSTISASLFVEISFALSARLDSLVHSLRICDVQHSRQGCILGTVAVTPPRPRRVARHNVSTSCNNDSDVSELHIGVFSIPSVNNEYFIFRSSLPPKCYLLTFCRGPSRAR